MSKNPTPKTKAAMLEARAMHAEAETPAKLSLLQEAHNLIHGQRQQDYGDKLPNFAHSAMLIHALLAPKLLPDSVITPEDVGMIMMQMKLARLAKSPAHRDSLLDIAGYAGCVSILQEERAAGAYLAGGITDYGTVE